jgi:hypothetical protein
MVALVQASIVLVARWMSRLALRSTRERTAGK